MDIEFVKNILDSSAAAMAFILVMSKLLDKSKYEKAFNQLAALPFGASLCVFTVSIFVIIWN